MPCHHLLRGEDVPHPCLLVPRSLWPFHLSLAHQIFLKSILVPVNYFNLEVPTFKSLYAFVLRL